MKMLLGRGDLNLDELGWDGQILLWWVLKMPTPKRWLYYGL